MSAQVFDHAVVFKHYDVDLSPKNAVGVGDASYGDEAAIVDDGCHAVARDAYYRAVGAYVGEGDASDDAVVGE